MRKIAALVRVSWITHTSYRTNVILSIVGMGTMFIPVYFIAQALQPVVGPSIRDQGQEYFGFLVVGIIMTWYLTFSMSSLPGAIGRGISSGTLESLFATPARVSEVLVGLVGYQLIWTTVRAAIFVSVISLVGVNIAWTNLPWALLILGLIVLAHLPIGLIAAALVLVLRTSGPLIPIATLASIVLGGPYYSTTVIPEVVRPLSAAVPLTYGLRAFRRSLLGGEPFGVVAPDVAILTAFAATLLLVGGILFGWALAHSRRAGTLGQY